MTIYTRIIFFVFILCSLFISFTARANNEVALTIDDLPFVGKTDGDSGKYRREQGRFMAVLQTLEQEHVPATGFVVAGAIEPGQMEWLEQFKQAGNIIGSHSYSHKSLGRTPIDVYIDDVKKADKILAPLMSSPKYYRFPYLSEGAGTSKFTEFRDYLRANNYVVAPVTIVTDDSRYNLRFLNIPWQQRKQYLDSYRKQYLNYIWSQTLAAERKTEKLAGHPVKQILLIHMNTLNSLVLPDIIQMFRSHGYTFITLPEALKDPFYKNDTQI